ncbi:MAG TPA: cupin domain-containing protein [Burkholderiales bacterium]|nr:cupin domain-containing protein [Burkholderiales bacterium]
MSQQPAPVRRIVTGHDASGRAVIIEDGLASAVRTVAERPGYRVTNLWITADSPAPINDPDRLAELKGIAPPPKGTVVRIIDYPPESNDPAERERAFKASFSNLYQDAQHAPKPGEHPGMHRTETVDYAIVMEGELTAILEGEETVMRAGDVLVQRGTNHAWANRSGKFARICFVLIDGKR